MRGVTKLIITLTWVLASMVVTGACDTIAAELSNEFAACKQLSCGLELNTEEGETYAAPILNTDVKITVSGVALRAVVKQQFQNPSAEWVEGVYSFPLPTGAAVNELRMKVGERVIVGEIHERQQAEQRYQQAKKTGRKASIVKAHRPNLFTTKVANLGPGETVEVEIAYFQELPLSTDMQQLRFPMVIGPRYAPAANNESNEAALDSSLPSIPTVTDGPAGHNPVSIEVLLNLGVNLAAIRSLYHEVAIEHRDTNYRVTLSDGAVPADRDFVLEFAPATSAIPETALLSEQNDTYQYGLVMLMPPQASAGARLAREVTVILDRSGSMGGASIVQAKAALLLALEQLTPRDRFNIVQFNSTSDQLFAEYTAVSPETLQLAKSYVGKLTATGGTEMMGALARAFKLVGSPEHVQQVVFITDGNVSNETQLFNYIEGELRNRRLFTVGIGSAPNQYFLQQAAASGRGFHTAIGDLSEVEQRMSAMFKKLQKPLLRDIEITLIDDTVGGAPAKQIAYWPKKIPDLYAGEPLAMSVRAKPGPVKLRLAGKLPDRHWHADLTLHGGQQRRGLAELWGQRKIDSLMSDYRRAVAKPERQAEIRQAVIDTALESHLVSKFTSFVAVDKTPSNIALDKNVAKKVARNLPHAWTLGKTAGVLPQTATDANWRIMSGLVLALVAGLIYLLGGRQRVLA